MVNQVYVSAIAGNIISFVTGASLSWSSPVISRLKASEDNPIGRKVTTDESSWIGSLLALGAIFGPFIFGFLADKIGRKWTLFSIGAPYCLSYLILAFATAVEFYYIARFIIGLALGGCFAVLPMYIGEIASDTNRGAMGSVMNVLLTFGLVCAYIIGPYAPLAAFNLFFVAISAAFMSIFFFLATESPYYHVAKGNHEKAEKCLEKLRGPDNPKVDELEEIKASIEQASQGTVADLIRSKGLTKALVISLSLVAFQQFSGITAILFYAELIFEEAGGEIAPEICSMIIGAVLFVTSFITPLFVDRLGRKMLLYISAIGMTLSEIPLGLYFVLLFRTGMDVEIVSFVPVVALIVYIITYNAGFGPLPWTVMGELFPPHVKSAAASMTAAFCWIISFIIARFFAPVTEAIGIGETFIVFTFFCIAAFIFTFFVVIETKGKSLQEIQDILGP